MGWESAVTTGFSAANAYNQMQTAQAQAQQTITTGQEKAKDQADDAVRKAGTLQTSFLQSGIALDSGSNSIVQQAFNQGTTNISRTLNNANATAANTVSAARTASLNTIANGLTKSGLTNPGTLSSAYSGSWLQDGVNSVGQDIGSAFDPSPVGPYLPLGF